MFFNRGKRRITSQHLILGGAVLVLIYLTIIPLILAVYGSLRDAPPGASGAFTFQNYLKAFSSDDLYIATFNSLTLALGGGSLAFSIGCFLAWVVERTNAPFKKAIYAAAIVDLMIPGVLKSISWVLLLSPRIGVINIFTKNILGLEESPFNIYSMGGMIWSFGADSFTLPFFLMAASLRSMDPSLEEAAMVSGSGNIQTFYRITLRLMLPAMLSTWLLLFIRGMETFEAPAVLGLPAGIIVLATEVYVAAREAPTDYNLAATFGVIYLTIACAGLYGYFTATRYSYRYAVISGKGFRPRLINLGRYRYAATVLVWTIITVVLFLPLASIAYSSLLPFYGPPSAKMFDLISFDNYRWLMSYDTIPRALRNNVAVGIGSATSAVLLSTIVAWIVIRTTVPGRKILDVLAFSPIAFPGIVFGLSLMWFYLSVPLPVYGTLWILLIAYTGKYLPICMRACGSALSQVHRELEESSEVSGASWWNTFWRVIIPLILPGMFAGWIYVLTLSFKVLSLPVLLAHAGAEVMPVLIFDLYDAGRYPQLNALGVLVVGMVSLLSFLGWLVTRRIGLEQGT